MKRNVMLPVFVESSLFIFIFLLLINVISLGEIGNAHQKEQLDLKVPESKGFSVELLQRSAK